MRGSEMMNHYEYFTMRGKDYIVPTTPIFADSQKEAAEKVLTYEVKNLKMGDTLVICNDNEPKGRWAYQVGEGLTLIGGWGHDY